MFTVVPPDHPRRAETEAAIRSVFLREHDARLSALPRLLVAEIDDNGVVCAASLRFAEDGFFSERYLDQPVETLVARRTGAWASRDTLVEIGSLAAARPGQVWALVGGVVAYLREQGIRWAFFTATARLRALIRWSGVPLVELAPADSARVENVRQWGGYYNHDPRVMLIGDHMLPALPRAAEARMAGGYHA